MVQMVLEAVTNELAGKRMLEDDYTFEIERRKEQAIAALARYESMSALVKKSLKGAALSNKSCEIENKFSDLGEMLVALTTLSDKPYDEIFQEALEEIDERKKPSKKRHLESVPSESEDLNVSDGKLLYSVELFRPVSFSLPKTSRIVLAIY